MLNFTKMHGLGNDFVVINGLNQSFDKKIVDITQLADRHLGIGFDQLLIIEPSKKADFFCRIYNADGSEAKQCGNGLRCVARFIYQEGLCSKKDFSIETIAGVYPVSIVDENDVRVTMGVPTILERLASIDVDGSSFFVTALSVGNPHAVLKVQDINMLTVDVLGAKIASHHFFSETPNVGFMQVKDASHIYLRTFEKGAGETHACGSNACAAVVAGILNGWLDEKVTVSFRYGSLLIAWKGPGQAIEMTGPATYVFNGSLAIES
ncbi:MAG TPA: diaminopimelate epimerase [Gammaproteobacteria bacterium]|jgi:diaminopimelate epimerase|nr:diaminopimelate epimerase [Gammaproteobacteria bacterium]